MNHGIKKEDILAIFQKEAKDIRVGDMHNGEFDFWVRFPEENEDEYYYCFKDEGCHMIYHRFFAGRLCRFRILKGSRKRIKIQMQTGIIIITYKCCLHF